MNDNLPQAITKDIIVVEERDEHPPRSPKLPRLSR